MAEPILLDRFRDNSYTQNQLINDKLDFIIGEVRDMKQSIRDTHVRIDKLDEKMDKLDGRITETRKELKADSAQLDGRIDKLEGKMDKIETEIKAEFRTARWQVIGLVAAQLVGIGAIIFAAVSALK